MTNPAADPAVIAHHTPTARLIPTDPTEQPQTEQPSTEQPDGYTLWAVFRRDPSNPDDLDGRDVPEAVSQLDAIVRSVEDEGVTIRGFYDVSGLRADADLMVWMHGPVAETLQWGIRQLRRAQLLKALLPVWNAMGVHRGAEFNKSHVPAFLRDTQPKGWLAVYPFVRSYDWYLLPPEDRSRMLSEHGRRGAAYRSVLSNTVAAFALGDYEWIVPLESDELTDLVDLMRDLRAVDARLHVREEIPFFTGRRVETAEIPEILQ
ncbi:MAG TPA: hydrogen peroxide-dependent heme synthase [Microbacteriaceae bacterium]